MIRSVSRPYRVSHLSEWMPEFIDSARIIGIGESTHGTEEFFRAQSDITQHLIRQERARLVLMELPTVYGLELKFLLHQPREALSAFLASNRFVTWHNTPSWNLIGFIRTWNLNHPDDQVRIVGIDPQKEGCLSMLLTHIKEHGEPVKGLRAWCTHTAIVEAQLKDRSTKGATPNAVSRATPDKGILLRIGEDLIGQSKELRADLADYPDCERALRFAAKHLQFQIRCSHSSNLARVDVRDELMAETVVEESTRLPANLRAVVLAHSAHISYGAPGIFSYGMGYNVRKAVGEASYRALITATGGGSVRSLAHSNASQSEAFTAEAPPNGALEGILHTPDDQSPRFFDVQRARSVEKLRDYLRESVAFRSTGSLVYRNEFTLVRPAEQFDGLIYFPLSTAANDPHAE